MEQITENTPGIEKQASISMMLIVGIVMMTLIYMNCTSHTEDESMMLLTLASPILTILLGMYTFTYRGKAYRISRVMFFIFLALSLLSIWALIYFIELGKAYAH